MAKNSPAISFLDIQVLQPLKNDGRYMVKIEFWSKMIVSGTRGFDFGFRVCSGLGKS